MSNTKMSPYLKYKNEARDLFIHFEHRLMYRYMPGFFFGIANLWCARHYSAAENDFADFFDGGPMLEIGPGNGNLLHRLLKSYPDLNYVGLEISPDLIEYMTEKFSRTPARFVNGDVCNIPFEDESFSTIVATGTISHWRDPALGLAEVHRVLRPGGTLYILDQLGYTGPYGAAEAVAQGFMGFGLSMFSEKKMISLFDKSPLEMTRYARDGQLFRAWFVKPKSK